MPERPEHRDQHSAEFDLVVDPDVDLIDPIQAQDAHPYRWDMLLAVAAGGVIGAEARYGLGRALPTAAGDFPWITLLINIVGCLLIGGLMVLALDVLPTHRLLRPLLGTGVLGGFTTFSTFEVDVVRLVDDHHAVTALLYVVASLTACLLAVWVGVTAAAAILHTEAEREPDAEAAA